MNLYITVEDKNKLKKAFLNLRKQQIIIVDDVVVELGYEVGKVDDYASFIVNQKIKKIIASTATGKKMQSIIYVNDKLNDEIIRGLIHFSQEQTVVDKVILLTEKGSNEDSMNSLKKSYFSLQLKKCILLNVYLFLLIG
jgi:hypothetical protein